MLHRRRLLRFAIVAAAFALIPLSHSPTYAAKAKTKAKSKSKSKAKATPPTVTVMYFDYSGKDDEMAVLRKGLAQMLITDLSSLPAIRLIERDRFQALLGELKLQQSKRIDRKTAGRIGKLLGCRFMVLGGYFSMMDTLRIDARVVEVETGRIIKSIGVSGSKGDFMGLERKLSEGIAAVLSSALPAPSVQKQTSRAPAASRGRNKRLETRKRAKKPRKPLHTSTVLRYARALDAKDRGDLKRARSELQAVVKARPDFRVAQLDLASMVQ